MAIPIKTTPKPAGALRVTTPAVRTAVKPGLPLKKPTAMTVSLPTEMSVPSHRLEDYCWLIYGPKKVGKTSLACQFPGAIVFEFEPASRAVRAFKANTPDWATFLAYIKQLETTQHNFNTAVIDTGFEAYQRCLEFVAHREGWSHPGGQNDFGASWKKVGDEFRAAHIRLNAAGMTVVILCHDKVIEDETRAGQKFSRTIPNLSGQADDYYRAAVDNMIYYHFRDKQRFLTLAGSDYIMAGVAGREENWLTPDGEQVWSVPADDGAAAAFTRLKDAFHNKQLHTFREETEQFEDDEITRSMREKAKQAQKKQNKSR